MPSTTPPPPSGDGDFDSAGRVRTNPGAGAILASADVLSRRGVFGFAFLDHGLIVRAVYGKLLDFLPEGAPASDTLLALIGLEDDIAALSVTPGTVLELPAVSNRDAAGATPRLNLLLIWIDSQQTYLLVASRPSAISDMEAELSRQMRARLMAEAEVSAKSKELARINAELSLANRDLSDFASIIAHDLSAPMRGLRDMTRTLDAALGAPTPDTTAALAAIQRLDEHTRRLSSMLRDLHEYSSIGRKQDAIETVATRSLAEAVVRSIPRPAAFTVSLSGDWPVIDTLAAPLDLVLRNLVDNAVKHHDRDDGRIDIVAHGRTAMLEIDVIDDGPGIAPEHRDAVFMPFRTLAPLAASSDRPAAPGSEPAPRATTESTSSTGMGLAFVKRTVEAVGGVLELTGRPDRARGARFRILWPRRVAV